MQQKLFHMFSFFGKIADGVAYGIGISMGFAIWRLLKSLFKIALLGGGVMAALHGIGVPTGSLSGLSAWFQQILHSGGLDVQWRGRFIAQFVVFK